MDIYTPFVVILYVTIFLHSINQIKKVINKKQNETTILLTSILFLLLLMFTLTYYQQSFQPMVWNGNELTLLKTNKSLNVGLQPLYNILVFIFKKEEIIQYLNILLFSTFFLIYLKSIKILNGNRKSIMLIFLLFLPLTSFFMLNSIEDNLWGIGLTLFLTGHFLPKNDKNSISFQLIGGLICLVFKEWLALLLILYLVIDFINDLFFKENRIITYGIFLFCTITFLFYIYSIVDVIRYTFFFLTFYLIISFPNSNIKIIS